MSHERFHYKSLAEVKEKASELDEVFMRDVIDFMEQAAETASQSGK